MTVQEILNVLSDGISDGKLDRNSQVTVMEYDQENNILFVSLLICRLPN